MDYKVLFLLTITIMYVKIVAYATVAFATFIQGEEMLKFMKSLNNISRAQASYRNSRISCDGICAANHAFVLAICKNPGRSQEELSRELCLNKSTVTRALSHLEENGYITRTQSKEDKRQSAVYPTEKMLDIFPRIKEISMEWNVLVSQDIPENELEIFYSVLNRMEERAKEINEKEEK